MLLVSTFVIILVTVFANSVAYPSTLSNVSDLDNVQLRIKGGKPAKAKQFPYQVGLLLVNDHNAEFAIKCGGTLISNQYVLTAVHCLLPDVENKNKFFNFALVTLGSTNLGDSKEKGRKELLVTSRNFIIHDGFDPSTRANDIALIKLPEPVKFDEYIQTADLPCRDQSCEHLVGKSVITSGWGEVNEKGDSTDILQYMKTKILPGSTCSTKYKPYAPIIFDDKRQICVYTSGKMPLVGDSGGPNVLKNTVVGVSSFVGGQGTPKDLPQVLTRVSYYLDWISQKTGISIKNKGKSNGCCVS